MRRDQVIALCAVIVLTTAVLAVKARVRTGGPDTASAEPTSHSSNQTVSATPTEASLASPESPTPVPELTPPSLFPEDSTAVAETLSAPGGPALLFFDGVYERCECLRRETEPPELFLPRLPRDLSSRVAVHRINVEERPGLAHQHRVMVLTTLVLLDANDEEVFRQDHGVYREPLIEAMRALLVKEPGGRR